MIDRPRLFLIRLALLCDAAILIFLFINIDGLIHEVGFLITAVILLFFAYAAIMGAQYIISSISK